MQPVHWTLDAVSLEPPLFQFHEEQDEDRPHPHGYRELNQLCVSQGISSWNQKRKPQHSQSREYPEDQFGFGVHHCGFTSLVLRLASSSQSQEGATPRSSYGCPPGIDALPLASWLLYRIGETIGLRSGGLQK